MMLDDSDFAGSVTMLKKMVSNLFTYCFPTIGKKVL
jgi:hypothetical protein